MYDPLQRRALALLKVPPEPQPPLGAPASLRVFRAGRNYFRLRLAGWATAQLLALAGIVFWTAMLFEVERIARAHREAPVDRSAATLANANVGPSPVPVPNAKARRPRPANWGERLGEKVRTAAATAERASKSESGVRRGWIAYKQILVEIGLALPAWAFPVIWVLKIFGIVGYLCQIPITYAVRRIDYEMRWYMVTDCSLRIRHGVWKVTESTMSFANLQHVTVTQGPVQRLLGLADVKVQSAGGGGKSEHQHGGEDMHVGLFHSVTNATEIRDLILDRVRRYRETGLGDPDEAASHSTTDPLEAARELVTEARTLRTAVT